MTQGTPLDYEPRPSRPRLISDDVAYILPMGIFLAITWSHGQWPAYYPLEYAVKTILTAITLIILWPRYTKIKWNHLLPGFACGVIGTVQWIAMQLYLQRHFAFFRESTDAFNPLTYFHNRSMMIAFIAVRMIGAVLVVPFMEERFWRDYLWRQIIAPNDFKLATIGEWSAGALIIVSVIFATVHGNWWLTAIVWGLMIGLLLVCTKSLGACIVCHATCNLLLGIWVLTCHRWSFW
jgi:CAAX prenyl protease-like protein